MRNLTFTVLLLSILSLNSSCSVSSRTADYSSYSTDAFVKEDRRELRKDERLKAKEQDFFRKEQARLEREKSREEKKKNLENYEFSRQQHLPEGVYGESKSAPVLP